MLRRTLTSLALVCAFVLSACSDSTIPTSPDAADLNGTSLQAAKLAGAGSLTGEVGGAKYYIEVPENWNGNLVLYAPGYVSPAYSADDFDPAGIDGSQSSPQARNFLDHWYTPSGDLTAPVLSLRTTRDPTVSPYLDALFAERVAAAGKSELSVWRQVERFGHCAISSAREYGPAFDDLVNWVENGVMPTP
jgi:hypothetical protein